MTAGKLLKLQEEINRLKAAIYDTLAAYGPGKFVAVSEIVREIERRASGVHTIVCDMDENCLCGVESTNQAASAAVSLTTMRRRASRGPGSST